MPSELTVERLAGEMRNCQSRKGCDIYSAIQQKVSIGSARRGDGVTGIAARQHLSLSSRPGGSLVGSHQSQGHSIEHILVI